MTPSAVPLYECKPRGAHVPLYLDADVVAYSPSSGKALPTPSGGGCLPLPPLGHGVRQWAVRGDPQSS